VLSLTRAAFIAGALLAAATVAAQPAATVPLRIIAINDFHGHLEPGDNVVQVPDPDEPLRTLHCAAAEPPTWPRASGSYVPKHATASWCPRAT